MEQKFKIGDKVLTEGSERTVTDARIIYKLDPLDDTHVPSFSWYEHELTLVPKPPITALEALDIYYDYSAEDMQCMKDDMQKLLDAIKERGIA